MREKNSPCSGCWNLRKVIAVDWILVWKYCCCEAFCQVVQREMMRFKCGKHALGRHTARDVGALRTSESWWPVGPYATARFRSNRIEGCCCWRWRPARRFVGIEITQCRNSALISARRPWRLWRIAQLLNPVCSMRWKKSNEGADRGPPRWLEGSPRNRDLTIRHWVRPNVAEKPNWPELWTSQMRQLTL